MSQITKNALAASLKRLLLHKPLHKITVSDIVKDCGIHRSTFYYHFQDIYALMEWTCQQEARRALQDKKTYATWQEGLLNIFLAVKENEPLILNAYNSVSKITIEDYLYSVTFALLKDVVVEMSQGLDIKEDDQHFVIDFYKYSFVGLMLDWIKKGMKEDPHHIVHRTALTIQDDIRNALLRFVQNKT